MTLPAFNKLKMLQLSVLLGVFLLFTLLPLLTLFLKTEKATICLIGVSASAILFIPILIRKQYDLFEPLTFLILTTLFGVTFRSFYVILLDDMILNMFILIGRPLSVVVTGGTIILMGLLAFVAGYSTRTPRVSLKPLRRIFSDRWSEKRLFATSVIFMGITLVFIALYMRAMNIQINDFWDLSRKRFLKVEDGKFTPLAYYRWGMSLSRPSFLILLTYMIHTRKSWFSAFGGLTIASGLLALFPPYLNSSRFEIAMFMMYLCMVVHYAWKPIPPRIFLTVGAVFLVLFFGMAQLRKGQSQSPQSALSSGISSDGTFDASAIRGKFIDTVVGNRNFFGIIKTSLIIDAVPDLLPYEYGKTFFLWLVAPIPRTVWPGKPILTIGILVSQKVYGISEDIPSGVPPGFFAELYWNFGIAGVLTGMFFLGKALRCFYISFKPHLKNNKNILLIYIHILFPVSYMLMERELGTTIIQVLTNTIPIFLAIFLISKNSRTSINNHTFH
ncbi:MAG: hypothetical protein GC154_18700 [bacterium]|nr:hypothetical protein [bacterium]